MSALVAFVFRDQFRAPEVLNELRRRDWLWVSDLDEAVAVTINDDGKARVHLSVDLSTYEGAGWARLWGSLLNTTLFIPLTDAIGEAADGVTVSKQRRGSMQDGNETSCESEWWHESLKTAPNFKRDVAALIAQKGSAIFMLLRAANTATALKQLNDYGDTIVHTSLSSEQDEKLHVLLTTSRHGRS